MMNKILIILISFALIKPVAGKTPEPLAKAFEKMEADSIYTYAYLTKTVNRNASFSESYNPERPIGQRWKLLSVHGEDADRKKINKSIIEKNRLEKSHKENSRRKLDEKDMQNFKLLNDSSNILIYSFELNPKENKKMAEFVEGQIMIDESQNRIQEITMYNKAPFSPALSVNIDLFRMNMKFQKQDQTGANKIKSVYTKIKGTALVFKKIDQEVKIEYFDYKLID